jgi:hypothetical protein
MEQACPNLNPHVRTWRPLAAHKIQGADDDATPAALATHQRPKDQQASTGTDVGRGPMGGK